jgi:outer membrane protein assembly factor BamB
MNIFSGKRYFNDILWAPAYNNNTLPDTFSLSADIDITNKTTTKAIYYMYVYLNVKQT